MRRKPLSRERIVLAVLCALCLILPAAQSVAQQGILSVPEKVAAVNAAASENSRVVTRAQLRFSPAIELPIPSAGGPGFNGLGTGDFNRDGHEDLVLGHTGISAVVVYVGDGAGRFTTGSVNSTTMPAGSYPIVCKDFNGDGFPDVALGTGRSPTMLVAVLIGNGNGTFQTSVDYAAPWAPTRLQAGDMNNDGILDLVVTGIFPVRNRSCRMPKNQGEKP